jgi:hypothetical protein
MMKRRCENCKFWHNENDVQGSCSLTLRAIDGENVDSNGEQLARQYDKELKGVTLECTCEVEQYAYPDKDYLFHHLQLSELFSDIQIWYGKNFCCCNHEYREDKCKK